MNYFRWLCLLLALKAICMVFVIVYAGIGLGPDEAQYWTWSQSLDWGYYSKPPGIAWQIWLGTKIFGNTELGVRFGSLVLAYLSSLAIYGLARASQMASSTAFWASVLFSFSPLGIMASLFAITDVGMFLFWTLACCIVAHSLALKQKVNYSLLGLVIFAGALFKWPIYFFWGVIILLWAFIALLRSPQILFGIAISLLGLCPSLVWNWQHDWATFRHVFATVNGGQAEGKEMLGKGNFLEFVAAQMALLSPLLFILFWISLWNCIKDKIKELSSPHF